MKKKVFLWIIFVFVVVHFLKDITQDILKIASPLDLLGNVNEDLSKFPLVIKQGFIFLGYLSFVAEIFLLTTIPLVVRERSGILLNKLVWVIILFLFSYLILAILLDPRFRLSFF